MKKVSFIVLIISFLSFTFVSLTNYDENLKSTSGNKQYTGGTKFPGTCANCHPAGSPLDQPTWLTTDIPAGGYVPGVTYNITVYAQHANAIGQKNGFALNCEANATNNNAGTFDFSSPNFQSPTNTGCVTHTSSSNTPNASGASTWTIPWTAPASGTGQVTFFTSMVTGQAGGGANGYAWKATNTVSENTSTDIEVLNEKSELIVFPNPANDIIYLNGNVKAVEIYSINGSYIESKSINNNSVEISNLKEGIYLIKISDERSSKFSKLMKF